ncbi:MAG: TrkH family potassium uptake protein [Euryarchaeota archaeon]|jgi:trk system potassium uptake protein TrkH|uniref:TrkH family potassium uptake protein n=1 Tax=Methanobacterium sp. MZD130B TaxID=3394378 RepID=UPI001762447A|nr:TrkH family potassium uptake protein [Euryarchaeota archaeon]HHT18233.1 TrkH family potassium uptake protein [Methanobacterium sp.]
MMGYLGKKDFLLIAKPLGIIMQGVGAVVIMPLIVAIIYHEPLFYEFIIFGGFSILLGFILRKVPSDYNKLKLRHGMIIAAVAWLWAALIGSFCLIYATNIDFLNAYFECMSAWSGSGFSIFTDVEILPKSILFFRSLMQWFGGLGIVIMVIGILIRPGTAAARLYKSEAREEKIKPSITSTVKTIWWIYVFYTILGIILYLFAGMGLFDAVNNTFTNLSTGGMSIKNNSIGSYNSDLITLITIILMIIGGTSFLVHYKAFQGRVLDVFKDLQFQAMIIIVAVFSILLVVYAKFTDLNAVFYVVSALSCTGSNTEPINAMATWMDYPKVILTIAMIIGMAAGSTTGALKLIRVITLFKGVYWEIKRILLPEGSVISRTISGKPVSDIEIREAGSYTFLYFFFILISWLVLMQYGYSGIDSFFEVASAQGNVGLSLGIISPNMPDIAEILLIFNMWIGRLEIIPVLVLFKGLLDIFRR